MNSHPTGALSHTVLRKHRTSRSLITTNWLVTYDFVSSLDIACNNRNSIVSMIHTERSMANKMEDKILSFRRKDPNQMGKNNSHQSQERRKYSSSGFYENHTEGHMLRSKECTHTDAKIDTNITVFSLKKFDCFISMSSITIRLTQSTLEMARKSKSNTSGWPTVARDADKYIHMHTWDRQCFYYLRRRREIRNSFDDVPDGALRTLSNGIELASGGLADAEM
jgi:hypothetical protein